MTYNINFPALEEELASFLHGTRPSTEEEQTQTSEKYQPNISDEAAGKLIEYFQN